MIAPLPAAQTSRARLFLTLAAERATLSPSEIEALAQSGRFRHDASTGLSLWYDPSHTFGSRCGTMQVFRAITDSGDLVWFCRSSQHRHAQIAIDSNPQAALASAKREWARPRTWRDTLFGRYVAMRPRPARGYEGLC